MTGEAFYQCVFNNAGVMILHAKMSSNSQVPLAMLRTCPHPAPCCRCPAAACSPRGAPPARSRCPPHGTCPDPLCRRWHGKSYSSSSSIRRIRGGQSLVGGVRTAPKCGEE